MAGFDQHEAFWATEGLFVIADAIVAQRGDEMSLVNKDARGEFACPTFTMRAYCGCEGAQHPVGCPPNFEFPAAGFELWWERLVGVHQIANREKPPGMRWELAVADCIRAVGEWRATP